MALLHNLRFVSLLPVLELWKKLAGVSGASPSYKSRRATTKAQWKSHSMEEST